MGAPQTLPADFNQWDSAPATLPADFNKWDEPRANTQSAPAQPSVMQVLTQPTAKTDKEYLGYTGPAGVVGATLHGLNDVAQGTKDAIKGAYDSVAQPPQDKTETAVSALSPAALPIYRMLRGLGHTAADATHVAAAIHDINQSADPTGSYLEAGEKTAAQGAGQALVALGTEGIAKAAGASASPTARAAASATPDAVSAALKKLPQAAIQKIPWLGDVLTDVYNAGSKAYSEAKGPGAPGYERYAPNTGAIPAENAAQVQSPGPYPQAVSAQPELDATSENKPFAGGADEPPPQKVLDATGENKPFAGGMDEAVQQALQEKGPNAPLSEVAQRAREIKASQAAPAQPNPRLAPDIANWQPPPELGVTSAPDYGAAARADVEKQMGGPLQRGTATAQADPILQKLRDLTAKNQADDAAEAAQPKADEDLTDILQKSLDAVRAKKPPQSVGSLTAAMQDTASFQQALQEKGPNAPLSEVAQRAQEIKAAKAKVKTGT